MVVKGSPCHSDLVQRYRCPSPASSARSPGIEATSQGEYFHPKDLLLNNNDVCGMVLEGQNFNKQKMKAAVT